MIVKSPQRQSTRGVTATLKLNKRRCEVVTAAGAVPVRQPRVNDKRTDPATGERQRFSSAILPAWARKSPRVAEVLPLLYLHGLSSADLGPALEQFLGTGHGLSAATVTRLTKDWQGEATAFGQRDLSGTDYAYVWVDGIHLKVRLAQDKVCLLLMIGVRADGAKELIALDDGRRESSESWADLLRSCKRRGMRPGARRRRRRTGVLEALRDVFADAKEQRCWWHKIGNVLAALPKSAQRTPRPRWRRSTTPKTATTSPRDPARGPPGSRWRSNSSSRHSTAGVPSIPPTRSRWSEPARSSRTASSSNDPTNQQAVTLTPHDTLIHRP
jgi:Transposase, Mutator family